jgi:folate-binding protein YgfZ
VFDYVRVSNGVPIAGRELTADVNPLEAKLHHLIDFDKGCYVGQEVIARLDTYDKVQRELIRFTLCGGDHATIRPGDRVLAPSGGRDVGWISSVAAHPETGDRIGLAYVRGAHANDKAILETSAGASIELQISQNATFVVAD